MSFGTSPGPELLAALRYGDDPNPSVAGSRVGYCGEMDRRNVANDAGYSGLSAFLMDTIRYHAKSREPNDQTSRTHHPDRDPDRTHHAGAAPVDAG